MILRISYQPNMSSYLHCDNIRQFFILTETRIVPAGETESDNLYIALNNGLKDILNIKIK